MVNYNKLKTYPGCAVGTYAAGAYAVGAFAVGAYAGGGGDGGGGLSNKDSSCAFSLRKMNLLKSKSQLAYRKLLLELKFGN